MRLKTTSILVTSAVIAFLLPLSCSNTLPVEEDAKTISEEFKSFWYQGKAEVASYKLVQSRYGELREGNASFIFVTEPFDPERQVKKDTPGETTSVFKVNHTRKFVTGIYPYSVMTSSFSEVETKKAAEVLKMTHSSQEWCGQTWSQLNRSGKGYQFEQYSYFEQEGDVSAQFPYAQLEDGIWAQIRFNPGQLPQGKFDAIPAFHFLRFSHIPVQAYDAVGTLAKEDSWIYTLDYLELNRKVEIEFEGNFPYRILGWKEIDKRNPNRSTSGDLVHSEMLSYWNLNAKADTIYRQPLGLE